MDLPPPNNPRVMQDGQLEVREGHTVPVLAQPSTHRLIVLNSTALGHMHIGQTLVLHLSDEEPLPITLEAIDRLALIARYIEGADEE
ncbi:MAG TPA: hypothetical protein VGD69_21110 [Herpetosiphonaceae bacterium]